MYAQKTALRQTAILGTLAPLFALDLPPMKLTIIRLQHFSDQDRIDLGKSGRRRICRR
jgi:hypothetical protein